MDSVKPNRDTIQFAYVCIDEFSAVEVVEDQQFDRG